MTAKNTPKAFISHASEDKDRFVLTFAAKLREKGVDAWLDRWEIKPGDSLVERIFEEGIKQADAFLVVVSNHAIAKRWVREELDSGVVMRIEKASRLIPVVIDECEVPQALKHLKWVKIKDLNNYPTEFSEIVSAIFGTSDRPPIGNPPTHSTATVIDYLPGLTKADGLIFAVVCRHYMKTGVKYIALNDVRTDLAALELSEEQIDESLEIMGARGFIGIRGVGRQVFLVELYPTALDAFMRAELPDYGKSISTVIAKIVNENIDSTTAIHESTGMPVPVILHIITLLESKGLLTSAGAAGIPILKITSVSAELRRILRH